MVCMVSTLYLDSGEAKHDLLVSINVRVKHTKNVLKFFRYYQRLYENERVYMLYS